jgi:D-alanine-D-alanine ligase-like ATP-grasp enzyme
VQEVEATFDDESGQIVLRVDITVQAQNGNMVVNKVNFQVTTLSINPPNNPP